VAVARGKDAPPLFPCRKIFLNAVPAVSRRLWIIWGLFCNFVEMYLIYFEFCIICSVDVKKKEKKKKLFMKVNEFFFYECFFMIKSQRIKKNLIF